MKIPSSTSKPEACHKHSLSILIVIIAWTDRRFSQETPSQAFAQKVECWGTFRVRHPSKFGVRHERSDFLGKAPHRDYLKRRNLNESFIGNWRKVSGFFAGGLCFD